MSDSLRKDTKIFDRYLRRPSRGRLAEVVQAFRDTVWTAALRITADEDDAADITQDVFLSLLLSPATAPKTKSATAIAY